MSRTRLRTRLTIEFLLLAILAVGLIIALGRRFAAVEIINPPTGDKIYYVAPTGSDANVGSLEAPFKTIAKARDAVKAANQTGATVYIRGGEYPETIDFDATNSGSSTAPNVYRNYPGEEPVLTGSQVVTGLTKGTGPIYSADLKTQGLTNLAVNQVYYNGGRQTLARSPNAVTPNYTQADPLAGSYWPVADDTSGLKTDFKFRSGDITNTNWTNPANVSVNIVPGPGYWNNQLAASTASIINRTITVTPPADYAITAGNRYFLENIYEGLDAAGEWYHDPVQKILYFYPPSPLAATDEVRVPVLDTGLIVTGASYLTFQGLTLKQYKTSGMKIVGGRGIELNGNRVTDLKGIGIDVSGASSLVTIKNNFIARTGNAGIMVGNHPSFYKPLTTSGLEVTNNQIRSIGWNYLGAAAISLDAIAPKVLNNFIIDTPRSGITFFGNNAEVAYNTVLQTSRSTADTGAIVTSSLRLDDSTRRWYQGQGAQVHDNFVSDTGGYAFGASGYQFNSGVAVCYYFDDWSGHATITNNLCTQSNIGLHLHSGRNSIVRNNVFSNLRSEQARFQEIRTGESGVDYPSMWADLQAMTANGYAQSTYYNQYAGLGTLSNPAANDGIMIGNTIEKNIFAYAGSPAILYHAAALPPAPTNKLDDNVVWASGQQPSVSSPSGTKTWAQWQASYDAHSVLADPLFANSGGNDFSLQAGSPALAKGIVSINQALIAQKTLKPTVLAVTDQGATTTNPNQLLVNWQVTDDNNFAVPVVEYQVRSGSNSGAVVKDWTATSDTSTTITGLTLTANTTYFLCVRAKNDALVWSAPEGSKGSISETVCSDGITFLAVGGASPTPTATSGTGVTPTVTSGSGSGGGSSGGSGTSGTSSSSGTSKSDGTGSSGSTSSSSGRGSTSSSAVRESPTPSVTPTDELLPAQNKKPNIFVRIWRTIVGGSLVFYGWLQGLLGI